MAEFPTINRPPLYLLPTAACFEWVKSCPDYIDEILAWAMQRGANSLSCSGGERRPDDYIRRHFKAMFEEELNSWYTDPSMWPKSLSFKRFKEFFTIHTTSMVYDLGKGQIVKD